MSLRNTFQNMAQKIGRDSTHDWYGALLCFALMLFVLFVVNTWMFAKLALTATPTLDVAEKKLISVNQTDIHKAIENTHEKSAGTANISGTLRTDPSL